MLSEKLFELNPRPLNCCHAITFANQQYKLSCSVKNGVSYVHSLVLGVQHSSDVDELEKFFNGK